MIFLQCDNKTKAENSYLFWNTEEEGRQPGSSGLRTSPSSAYHSASVNTVQSVPGSSGACSMQSTVSNLAFYAQPSSTVISRRAVYNIGHTMVDFSRSGASHRYSPITAQLVDTQTSRKRSNRYCCGCCSLIRVNTQASPTQVRMGSVAQSQSTLFGHSKSLWQGQHAFDTLYSGASQACCEKVLFARR